MTAYTELRTRVSDSWLGDQTATDPAECGIGKFAVPLLHEALRFQLLRLAYQVEKLICTILCSVSCTRWVPSSCQLSYGTSDPAPNRTVEPIAYNF